MKIIYFGSDSSFSIIPFLALINSNHNICAFAYDDVKSDFPIIKSNSIQSIALNNSIPLIKMNGDYTNTVLKIKEYQPDVIIVSCYSRLLPLPIISSSKFGCFNIHPSLLPQYRGPVPLFWQFRDGVDSFGVTLHRVEKGFDTGNIISQRIVKLKGGVSKNKAMDLLAEQSSGLILTMLEDIRKGKLTESVQDNVASSYQSYPKYKDYRVSTSWTGKRIYDFVNAYKGEGVYFLCEVKNKTYKLLDVYSYQKQAFTESVGNDDMIFPCKTGYVKCMLKLD